jgi:uncharacterized protein with HEPN domain
MNEKDLKYIERINIHCQNIISFVERMSFDDFVEDIKTCQACVLSLIQIGENASKLSSFFKANYDYIEWRLMINLRNRIAHQYESTKWQTVWQTITEDIPELHKFTQDLINYFKK